MSEQIPSTELSGYYAWTHTLQGVYYGPGCVSMALPKLLDTLGASKAMVVTGNSLYTKVCQTKCSLHRSDFFLFLPFPTTQTNVVKKVEGILREQNRYAATFHNIGEHADFRNPRRRRYIQTVWCRYYRFGRRRLTHRLLEGHHLLST